MTEPRPLRLLAAPSSAGAYGPGQERAPAAFRWHGLLPALTAAGPDVEDGDRHLREVVVVGQVVAAEQPLGLGLLGRTLEGGGRLVEVVEVSLLRELQAGRQVVGAEGARVQVVEGHGRVGRE